MNRKNRHHHEPPKSSSSLEADNTKRNDCKKKEEPSEMFNKFNLVVSVFAIAASLATVGLYFITKDTLQIDQRDK
jgi:hypothetical protein